MLDKIFRYKDSEEYEFLPSALEITEKPVSPKGQIIIWLIFIIIVALILWSCFGKVEVVASARGKIIPDGRLKVIQTLDDGIITSINVVEGQVVTNGQLLVELDTTLKDVDINMLQDNLEIATIEIELLNAFLNGETSKLKYSKDIPYDTFDNLIELNTVRLHEYKLKREDAESRIKKCEFQIQYEKVQLRTLENNLNAYVSMMKNSQELLQLGGVEAIALVKLEQQMDILIEYRDSYYELLSAGAIARQEYQSLLNEIELLKSDIEHQAQKIQIERIQLDEDYKNMQANVSSTELNIEEQKIIIGMSEEALYEAQRELSRLEAEQNLYCLNQIINKEKEIISLQADIEKIETRLSYQNILSPVDGTILSIARNTIGGVVTSAEPIITIVPKDTPLVVEGYIENKDIGFITIGQEAALKVDAFQFQKYGYIKGSVLSISPDVIEDEKRGAVYRVLVKPEQMYFTVGQEQLPLQVGMTMTIDINIGKRRIIEFFLEPIIKYVSESLSLR